MIIFKNNCSKEPYNVFRELYSKASLANQQAIEAIAISSYDKSLKLVDSRYVNLKIVDNEDFIFFSNYNSPKSRQFSSHDQISAMFYWVNIDCQIRIKANINKVSKELNNLYFLKRDLKKNALAISSEQSENIESYEKVVENYQETLKNKNLSECPEHWGGYSFTPFYFEFWEGHESRINKRNAFENIEGEWQRFVLQP